jgi:transportin-3
VLEDYLQMLLQLIDHAPDVFFHPSTFPLAFKASMAALTVIHADIVFAALDLFRGILTHESLTPPPIVTPPLNFPAYAATIVGAIEEDGFDFVGYLLSGLIGDFPEDSTSAVISIFRAISVVWSAHLLACLPAVVQQLPAAAIPTQAKTQFLTDVNRWAICFVFHCFQPFADAFPRKCYRHSRI